MARNERATCKELIEPALKAAGWSWDREVMIGPGRVNLGGESMYDGSQRIVADYVLRLDRMPLAILEAKAESFDASAGMQQGSRYADRLGLRFSIAGNGRQYVLTDNSTGNYEILTDVPSPEDIIARLGHTVGWSKWRPAFNAPYHVDQVSRKTVRAYQEMAIFRTLCLFGEGRKKVLLLMATGTGKTFTVFQLAWKLLQADVLANNRILFLTDRNSLKDQAFRAFSPMRDDRVVIHNLTVSQQNHLVGKVYFANYQNMDEALQGKKLYQHFDPDFFDLVIVDECHRSGFGDWFGVLKHFESAYQLGLTATPRELDQSNRVLPVAELRRDTFEYFGEPAYTYSLKQAIEDGYLVPYLLEERISNLDENGYTGPDGKYYTTGNFERDIRMPERTELIAEDLYGQLKKYGLHDEKTIIFCVDDTHAAFMAAELRRITGDGDYAARITRSERNSHQLERNFAEVGQAKPRVAVTVDLLTTGYDAPDVKNIVFARPIKSSILYKQMKGRGTRLCEDIDKRYFTIFDYTGAAGLEDTEFDGHPANLQKSRKPSKKRRKKSADIPKEKPVAEGVSVFIQAEERYVCLADGRKIPFNEYREQSKEVIRSISTANMLELLNAWIDKNSRQDLRDELKDRDVHISAFRHFYDLNDTDDVDIISKVGFDLVRVPNRHGRVVRFWNQEDLWLRNLLGVDEAMGKTAEVIPFPKPEKEYVRQPDIPYARAAEDPGNYGIRPEADPQESIKVRFWQTCLDHYSLYGIDDLEKGSTYSAPQFVDQYGSFSSFLKRYGDAQILRSDLESVKEHLYIPMSA